MRLTWIALAAAVVPLVWGFAVHWLLQRIWPAGKANAREAAGKPLTIDPMHYEI